MIMEIAVSILCLVLALAVALLIPTILELRRTAKQTTEFLKNTEGAINSAMAETEATMKSVREISDNVNGLTSGVRDVTDSVVGVAADIRRTGRYIENMTLMTAGSISGIRAAVLAVVQILIDNLLSPIGRGKGGEKQ